MSHWFDSNYFLSEMERDSGYEKLKDYMEKYVPEKYENSYTTILNNLQFFYIKDIVIKSIKEMLKSGEKLKQDTALSLYSDLLWYANQDKFSEDIFPKKYRKTVRVMNNLIQKDRKTIQKSRKSKRKSKTRKSKRRKGKRRSKTRKPGFSPKPVKKKYSKKDLETLRVKDLSAICRHYKIPCISKRKNEQINILAKFFRKKN